MEVQQHLLYVLVYGVFLQVIQIYGNGTPFGKIKGPSSKNDRIAIIGAGASGIHMAYKLKDLGFKHVTIFESSGRIGGKTYTLYHRNVPQELGTVALGPDYTAIYDLASKFEAGRILTKPEPAIWNKEKGSQYVKDTIQSYTLKTVYELKGISDPSAAFTYFQQALSRYTSLHVALFGTYAGELMPRPSEDNLRNITESCSFLELLQRYDLEVLKSLFIPYHTVQGYGHLDEIPAFYGLMWNTPNVLNGVLTSTPQDGASKMLENGFQFLWEEIARQTSLDIRYYHEVNYIKRVKIRNEYKYAVDIYYRKFNWQYSKERFDFLIITPTMKMMLEKMDCKREEADLFANTHHTYFTATVLDTDYGVNRPLSPTSYFLSDIGRKVNNYGGWALRDSYAVLKNITGVDYSNGTYPGGPDGKYLQTSVFYQMSEVKQRSSTIYRRLTRYLKRVLKMNIGDSVEQVIWSYFPRYSKEDLADGVLWNIYDLQGKYNTWYIGSSVCFESVKSVVEYNLLLLRNYDVPS